ncbi:hypothetical protein LguiB_013640 [Lonicera macranthoides]
MDFHRNHRFSFSLLIIFSSLLCLHSRADEGTGSVFFLDSKSHQYLRSHSSDSTSETNSMLLPEVVGAVSVLLGVPPPMLSASSSDKLNEVLMPNPFDRPRAVFMLEVSVAEGNDYFGNTLGRRVIFGQKDAEIQLPDEDSVSVVSLNEPLSFDSDSEFTDKDLHDFASWLRGSYITNALEQLTGELTFPLANGVHLKLHMSKKTDREFTTSLVSLIHNIKRATEIHQDLSGSMHLQSELVTGSFDSIKVLQEQYGTDAARQGLELFVTSVSKIFDSLQTAYKGQIVGVILFNEKPQTSEKVLKVKVTSRPSARWLEEKKASANATMIAEVVLVRRVLAWITGIILIIATLLGIYFLMNMPLTRDTLLYSNVKLD